MRQWISASRRSFRWNADVLGLQTDDSRNYLIYRTFNSEIVALESCFAPAIFAVLVSDLHEDPAGLDPVADDGFDLGHLGEFQTRRIGMKS